MIYVVVILSAPLLLPFSLAGFLASLCTGAARAGWALGQDFREWAGDL